ncbi:MAG: tRNA epoxyqueuosine(34) reductase QueG [Elusimicrobia bacterium]|nr:tRNA epoxyqueuosine(34) reductase QueG [Elusimicrobiota bacterium]
MLAKEDVRRFASEVGIDLVGFARACPMEEARRRLADCASAGLIPAGTGGEPERLPGFCDPRSVLPTARSVVCAAQCYLTAEPEDLSKPGEPHGLIARYTWRNHYRDLKERLSRLAGLLAKSAGPAAGTELRSACHSNGPLAEKPLAVEAGLGSYGKHGIVITKGHGSWVVLGELVTELDFEPDRELKEDCGSCAACVDACPSKAIVSPGVIDRSRCLQHLTNSPSPIPPDLRPAWGRRLYGCTTCQEVCPKNAAVKPAAKRTSRGEVGPSLPLMALLRMTESEYRGRYAGNQIAAGWVRFESILRNACLALGNSGDPAAVAALAETLSSERSPLVRGHAAWALGRLGGRKARTALERCLASDPDKGVKKESAAYLGLG